MGENTFEDLNPLGIKPESSQDSTFKKSIKKYELLASGFIMNLDPRKHFRLFDFNFKFFSEF